MKKILLMMAIAVMALLSSCKSGCGCPGGGGYGLNADVEAVQNA